MSDYDAELRALNLKHKGPCPEAKGHCSEGFAFLMGTILGLFIATVLIITDYSMWERWSIKNGYAHYDATTGYVVYNKNK